MSTHLHEADYMHLPSPGVVGIAALVEAVPSLLNVSNIDGIQFSNVNSGESYGA